MDIIRGIFLVIAASLGGIVLIVASFALGIALSVVISWLLVSCAWWGIEYLGATQLPDVYFWPVVGVFTLLSMLFNRTSIKKEEKKQTPNITINSRMF
jgi:hypothetical protein